MFKKILIANRGEIAVRVIRACRELGIATVAVFSEADRDSLPVRMADEAYGIGPPPATESYLRADKILEVAKQSGAEAIHPGYGFLSENADFSDACRDVKIKFIGPPGSSMRRLGDKISARLVAEKVGVPIIPGMDKPLTDAAEAKQLAAKFGYPVLLKARSGGGGKGMRKVTQPSEMESAFQRASSEARQSFKDAALYLEKYIEQPHHVEMQILGDTQGDVVALGERECSAQRRHQKVIEESPSPFILACTREKLLDAAIRLAREANYENAGTMDFLVDRKQNFYFLEMNARLQVEHPVTEQVTGIDLVRAQLAVAAGENLESIVGTGLTRPKGAWTAPLQIHSIECRIYAEDPFNNFMPSPGKITHLRNPEGPGVRVDSAVYPGCEISVHYDPMIAKLITWGANRGEALLRMKRALMEYQIVGVRHNIPFHQALINQTDFQKGSYDTGFIERVLPELQGAVSREFEEIAKLAVEIHKKCRGGVNPPGRMNQDPTETSLWRQISRREGLR